MSKPKGEYDLEYHTVSALDVAGHYVKGFVVGDQRELKAWEHWYDPHKGTFIFRLFVGKADRGAIAPIGDKGTEGVEGVR